MQLSIWWKIFQIDKQKKWWVIWEINEENTQPETQKKEYEKYRNERKDIRDTTKTSNIRVGGVQEGGGEIEWGRMLERCLLRISPNRRKKSSCMLKITKKLKQDK